MSGVRALSPALQAKAEHELHEDPGRRGADVEHIRDWLSKQPHIKANNPSDQVLSKQTMSGVRALSPALQAKAEHELNEEPGRRGADVEHIRDWLSKQPHIKANNPSDQTLIAFLRGCKFSLERTKEKLDMYYTLRTAVPEFFKPRDVSDPTFKSLMQNQTFFPLPEPDEHGRIIFMYRIGAIDTSHVSVLDFTRIYLMYIDVLMRESDNMMVGGTVDIIDLTGISISLVTQITPSYIKKIIHCMQDVYPVRLKSINCVNPPVIMHAVIALSRSLLKDKINKRTMSGVRALSPALQAKAEHDLHEDPGRRGADVEHIRDWLSKQPHIKANPDDLTLIAFLRGCKFSLERTKEKLAMYYTLRTAVPEFFENRDVSDPTFKCLMQNQSFFPLPEPDEHGRIIFMYRLGAIDTSKVSVLDFTRIHLMCIDVLMRENDNMMVGGIVHVIDLSGVSISLVTQLTPSYIKKIIHCIQDVYPVRLKSVNIVNTPVIMHAIIALCMSLLNDKISKRISMHGSDMTSLYKQVPQRLLPHEYGGTAGTIKQINDAWITKVESYALWFSEDAKCGVDESKRPGKPKTEHEGRLKQLCLCQ